MLTTAERFSASATPEPNSGCALWIGTYGTRNRYGIFCAHGQRFRAHRYSYELAYGPIPAGLVVCHRCGTPECVNPDHLFVGTQADNVLDAISKGRIGSKLCCANGHPKTAENLKRRPRNKWTCRMCWNAHRRRRFARKRS